MPIILPSKPSPQRQWGAFECGASTWVFEVSSATPLGSMAGRFRWLCLGGGTEMVNAVIEAGVLPCIVVWHVCLYCLDDDIKS